MESDKNNKSEELKSLFIHRELSWLAFNERVLEEAEDLDNPLLERIKFLAIFVNNLDEFYMVRVAGVKGLIDAQYNKPDGFGYYPEELLTEVDKKIRSLMKKIYQLYNNYIDVELPKNKVYIMRYCDLEKRDQDAVDRYFKTTVYPVMTPMAVDQGHPFPVLPSKTLSFSISVRKNNRQHFAILPVPNILPRLYKLRSGRDEFRYIFIEDIVRNNLSLLFREYDLGENVIFRVLRDSELYLEEEYADDLLTAIEHEVKKRVRAKAVNLDVEKKVSNSMLERLSDEIDFPRPEIRLYERDLDLSFLFGLYGLVNLPELKYRGFVPAEISVQKVFDYIHKGDRLIHVPYQSFQPVADLISQAADDRNILAIKITLYRINEDSTIINSLKRAATNGKQVSVLVEIRARFEEEKNISWSRELEKAGCHVMYGIPGIKIHSKIALIVRQEEDGIKRYVHLSTGNYNEITARVYTDIGFMTDREDVCRDVSDVFNVITGYSQAPHWSTLVSSPNDLRQYFFQLIEQEMKNQKKYGNGFIFAKMNSLEDRKLIRKLYTASEAGVQIKLLVRGICCLIPGIAGMSDNIEVRSIVGRFLEHSRIYLFNNNEQYRVFLSSADWMRRNFDRRIELLFPIIDEKLKAHIKWLLELYWQDNAKARILMSDHTYRYYKEGREKINIQEYLIKHYAK